MNEGRVVTLLVLVAVLALGNIGATVYFGMSKPASADSPNAGSAASREVSEKDAASLVRNVVTLYNEDKIHELYLTFDDLARIQISEQKMSQEMAKVRALAGKVDDYAFLNSEVAGKQGDRPVITLSYKARLSGATFTSGTIRVSVMKKDGQLALLGFFVNAQTTSAQ